MDFPLKIKVGFKKIFELAQHIQKPLMDSEWKTKVEKIEREQPQLSSGISPSKDLKKYSSAIDTLLLPIFPPVFSDSDIKFATVPFGDISFKGTAKFSELSQAAGIDSFPGLIDLDEDLIYIYGCNLIASLFYGRNLDFKKDFHCNIPDGNGILKNYRVLYDTSYVEIEKTEQAPELGDKDFEELLESFNELSVWKEKFPPESYIFNGFVIATLIDVTIDTSISEFKTDLLRLEVKKGFDNTSFTTYFRSIFNISDLKIGYADYNADTKSFERVLFKDIPCYLLNEEKSKITQDALCSTSHSALFEQKEFYVITDTHKYHSLYPENPLYKKLADQGIGSAIFAAVIYRKRILGILEIVSPKIYDLTTINANKLMDIMPFLVDSVVRAKKDFENQLELIVQAECTSIHNSVHWKFRKEAQRYLESLAEGYSPTFREVVFHDVFPLYGQIDIKGSSVARNTATQEDLTEQLKYVVKIIRKLNAIEPLPVFDQMEFTIQEYLEEISDNLQVDTERKIVNFLSSEIIPFFDHLKEINPDYKILIEPYNNLIDLNTGLVYKHRKDYDESVMQVNKALAGVLDKEQRHAQEMFPHYYERFKTDGVEHNLYIGPSITNEKIFNPIYLKNLKIWQLQVMCKMENTFYRMKDNLPVDLEVASMILVFNGSLSLRFRMDEKRFDVDGTYNARYEVVKKRVDKAHIKGSSERIAQPGKLAIVYSQKEDEEEYTSYIKFLQSRKMFSNDMEIVELEDLQGVTGLKAIRVSILYSKKDEQKKEFYTYEDLISELHP